jgi:hypothetical protein
MMGFSICSSRTVRWARPERFLYHNNGDGTFSQTTAGSLTNDSAISDGCLGDYSNDGFLDLFVTSE